MNETQVKTFLTVAECLNFTEASYRLYTAQSAVSRTISAMEQELGYPLFIRLHQDIRLTAAGIVLRDGLEILYREYSELKKTAERANMELNGTLAIGFPEPMLMDAQIQGILTGLQRDLPEVRNHLLRADFGNLVSDLLTGRLDAIFTLETAVAGIQDLRYVPAQALQQYLLIPKDNPLLVRKSLKLSDFWHEEFISLQPSEVPQLSAMIRSVCLAAGFDPVIREVETRSDALLWVETGRGVGVFTEYDFACFSPLLEKRVFPELPPQNLVLAWCPRNTNPLLPEIVGRVCPEGGLQA